VYSAGLALLLVGCGGGAPTAPHAEGPDLRDPPPSTLRSVAVPALTLRVLRVDAPTGGGGDAVVMADSAAGGPWYALIDAGGDDVAARYLDDAGIDTLDLLVLTHAHSDHFGGMQDVFDRMHVRRFVYNGQARALASYQRVLERARMEADTVIVLSAPHEISFGTADGAHAVLLPPLDTWLTENTDDGSLLNEGSLGLRVQVGSFAYLGTGDAEIQANRRFADSYPDWVDADALKAGHHGSTDAVQSFWLDAVSPELVVVSANGTTHPHGAALDMYRARTPDLFCTPDHGIVTVRVSAAGDYAVRTERDPRARCTPGTLVR